MNGLTARKRYQSEPQDHIRGITAMSRLTFLYQMDLPHRAVAVYTYLHDRANKNGECWPSVNTIAGDIKLSPATVRRAIKDLKKAGLIETKQRYREKGGKTSLLYKIQKI